MRAWAETEDLSGLLRDASDDGQAWTTVHTVTDGNGGIDGIDVTGDARYVRVNTSVRGTPWGYSLYEFGVYRS
ncbi:hypothetical protein [Streptomyces sp. NPDC060322]|uniref:hypothetical protein n=1 Tax=Streptomyces sp. NPDC060322 TaxID=3347097 RepID=UPI00365CC105